MNSKIVTFTNISAGRWLVVYDDGHLEEWKSKVVEGNITFYAARIVEIGK